MIETAVVNIDSDTFYSMEDNLVHFLFTYFHLSWWLPAIRFLNCSICLVGLLGGSIKPQDFVKKCTNSPFTTKSYSLLAGDLRRAQLVSLSLRCSLDGAGRPAACSWVMGFTVVQAEKLTHGWFQCSLQARAKLAGLCTKAWAPHPIQRLVTQGGLFATFGGKNDRPPGQ